MQTKTSNWRRTDNVWPIYVSLVAEPITFNGWQTPRWRVAEFISAEQSQPAPKNSHLVFIELFQDERASYRLNLDLDRPKLFIVCDLLADDSWLPTSVTPEQSIATACLEAETPVLSIDMPAAIACWIEAFISRHGEVPICAHRRKHVNQKQEQARRRRSNVSG
ncbi:DUF3305 domain-containing protein [Thalassotalea maritima]|uniref:DUF3305 domain-containing protein n=1 Tax=Thalassotalea maritima TaxID=3242416 RepID=UPI0035279D35